MKLRFRIPLLALGLVLVGLGLLGPQGRSEASQLFATLYGRSTSDPALTVQDSAPGGDLLVLKQGNGRTATPQVRFRINEAGSIILRNGQAIATETLTPTPTPTFTNTPTSTHTPTITPTPTP